MERDSRDPRRPLPAASAGEAVFAAIWVLAFLIARHALAPWLDSLHPYAMYGFDLLYSALSIHFFSEGRFRLRFPAEKLQFAAIAMSLILGVMTYEVASMRGIVIPFNLEDPYTIFALLIIAPVLEELLFRQALWFSLETASARWPRAREWFPWIATSVLFAAAHFEATFSAPPEFHAFILYQTGYALAIALWWGRVYLQTGSVGLTILLHFGFNAGFFLGSVI